ncbi:E3 ubiquitin-protein ligase Mdm2 isoform X2 [Ciona intestinalis]
MTSKIQYFRTTPKLLAVLQMGGASGQIFTADQIVLFLGKYIETKKLFNPSNKRLIRCKNDLLGEVFKTNHFTVTDFKDLWKLLFPSLLPATQREVTTEVQPQPPQAEQPTSSKASDAALPWWYFISPRGENVTSDHDSNTEEEVGSYHERATVEAHDSEYESEDEFVEYEPVDTDSEISDDDTEPITSDEEDTTALHRLKEFQSDDEGEDGTTDISIDSDIALEELWSCPECRTRNSPKVGFCQGCWKLRGGWVEGGVTSQGMTSSMEQSSSYDVTDGRVTENNRSSSPIVTTMPSFMTSQSLKHKLDDVEPIEAKKPHLDPADPADPTLRSETSSGSTSSMNEPSSFPGLCNICRNNPNDATMVHGNNGHQFCCFRCAKRLKRKGKSCPVCRQPIMLVLRNYIVQF